MKNVNSHFRRKFGLYFIIIIITIILICINLNYRM